MNILSGDDFLKILTYLPGSDVTRFIRLKKDVGTLIKNNPRQLHKPIVSLGVNVSEEISDQPREFNFTLTNRRRMHTFQSNKNDSSTLLNFELSGHRQIVEHFFENIFSKADLHFLAINQYKEVNQILKKVILNTNCRIYFLQIHFLEPIKPEFREFIAEICRIQQIREVPIRLHLTPRDYLNYINMEQFSGNLFPEVVVQYFPDWITLLVNVVLLTWITEPSKLNGFLCTTYISVFPDGAVIPLDRVMDFDETFNKFRNAPWCNLEGIELGNPTYILLKKFDEEKLKFTLRSHYNSVIVTMEIIKNQ